MKKLRNSITIFLASFFSLIIISCEKMGFEPDSVLNPDGELIVSYSKSVQINDGLVTEYLMGLISTIETMVDEGVLNYGNGNALISKINNAIKSIAKGNTKAASGQLNATVYQVEAFIENGSLNLDLGESLIIVAENGINLLVNGIISLEGTTWDFTVNYSSTISWHADVTFYADGTTKYDEPEYPGIFTFYGTWSVSDNTLDYIMDSSGSLGSNYHYTGTINGTAMNGTFTLGSGTGNWSAVFR